MNASKDFPHSQFQILLFIKMARIMRAASEAPIPNLPRKMTVIHPGKRYIPTKKREPKRYRPSRRTLKAIRHYPRLIRPYPSQRETRVVIGKRPFVQLVYHIHKEMNMQGELDMRFVKQLYKGGQAFLESLVKKMKPRDLYSVTVKIEDVQLSRRIGGKRVM